ncbi:uncharacterized protein LOC120005406 [Tripterygium wilfordii]|uniref:uncharacterized protein LOC120005406 n=1 Tax=Tripterygium wilfordii TaxID=458696 RepID=UPI0018F7FDF6|nr:uncharacterized protein LOC120005406 [Tripterygium wilfordii]
MSSGTQPPSLPLTTPVDPPTPAVESLSPEILREGLVAFREIKKGQYLHALLRIRQSMSNYKDSPHLHAIDALNRKLAAEKLVDDFNMKLKQLNRAVQSAKFAMDMLPNSLYFALLSIDALYQTAEVTQEGWDTVIRQCKCALLIENSTDPGVDRFLGEDEMQNSSKEARIENTERQIRLYLHACQHLIKADAAKMEVRMERMKAIVGDWILKKQRASQFSVLKEKGKDDEEENKCKDLWSHSLTEKKKKEIRSVNLKDLEMYFNSLDGDVARELLEAISWAKEYKIWKYWECFCGKKFEDCNLYKDHFRKTHGPILMFLKEEIYVCNKWITEYLKGEWRPLDSDMATPCIFSQWKSASEIVCNNELADSDDLVEKGSYLDCYLSDDLDLKIKERVVFNTHFSGLLVDLRSWGREFNVATDIDATADNASATPFSLNIGQKVISPESDDFISWLYGSVIGEDFKSWECLRDSQRKKAKEVYQILEKECLHLKKTCRDDEISKMQRKIKAIQVVDRYVEENENGGKSPKQEEEDCVTFLRKRHEDLQGKEDIDSLIESEVISDVLKEQSALAQAGPSSNQSGFGECSIDYEVKSQEGFPIQMYNNIRLALEIVRQQMVIKNAIILQSAGYILCSLF